MSVFKDRTDEEKINHQGLKMTIDTYVGANKIKVRFEDGYVTGWEIYSRFKSGEISNPYFKDGKLLTRREMAKKIIGEVKKNALGQEVKIIGFRDFDDIDVRIEDGTVVKGITYREFKKGTLNRDCKKSVSADQNSVSLDESASAEDSVNPTLDSTSVAEQSSERGGSSHIGEEVTSIYGEKMVLTGYHSSGDVEVTFADGSVRTGIQYSNFKRGCVVNLKQANEAIQATSKTKKSRTGISGINNKGYKMTILVYNSARDMLVQFYDYTFQVCKCYFAFKTGQIRKPQLLCSDAKVPIGEESFSSAGERMTIVGYNSPKEILVKFDDGSLKPGITYSAFKKGTVNKKNCYLAENSPCSTITSKIAKDCPEVIPVVSDPFDDKQENTEVPALDISVPTTFSNCTDLSISNPATSEIIPTSASTESIPIAPDQQKQALFNSAESFRLSAESLGTVSDSVTIAVALLYKNAIRDYLKYAVDSVSEDIRVLGIMARKQGIDVNPRDLAWVNDFDFSFEDKLLKPNSEDLNILAGIVMGIRKQIISL